MFDAKLISLGDGQSYKSARVLEDSDLDKFKIDKIFEDYTGCFFADGRCIVLHHWNFKIIQLFDERKTGPNCKAADRLVLSNELIYQNIKIIPSDNWDSLNIPSFFIKRNGETGQFAFSCDNGTFITADTNITSIIMPDPRKNGITKSYNKASLTKSSFLGNVAE